VVVPTTTFAATAEVAIYLGATPVLADVDSGSACLSVDHAAAARSERTRVVMPVHLAGYPCDLDGLLPWAASRHIRVLEDAAHCLPAVFDGVQAVGRGDATALSFYATKNITTGEGGALLTGDAALAERVRRLSLHGISKDAWKRYTSEGTWRYDIIEPGFKYNLTDIAAALGLAQLARSDEFHDRRRAIAARYSEAFARVDGLAAPPDHPHHAWHLYILRVGDGSTSEVRDEMIERVKAMGIGTSVHFIPLHMHSYYRDRFGYQPGDFPNALALFNRSLSLPLYPALTDDEVDRVIESVTGVARELFGSV
jgi:perosamine synthetase